MRKPQKPASYSQLGWTLVGWLNAIAVAIIVAVVWGPPLTVWWILGGALVAFGAPVLFLWRALKK